MTTLATAAFLILFAAAALTGITVILGRGVRLLRERLQARRAAAPRRLLLALAAGGGEEEREELVRMPAKAWNAVEPTAFEMLAKVRGEGRDALAEVFDRRGLSGNARRDLHRRGAIRRARAAAVLGSLQDRAAVPELCELLNDRHTVVRVTVIQALGRIGDPLAVPPLMDSLRAPRRSPSLLVAHALVQVGHASVPDLIAALQDEDALVRVTALDALRLLGAAEAGDRAAQLLSDDPSPLVREHAAATIGRVGTYTAVKPLLAAVSPTEPVPLRAAAARALGELGIPAAAQPLIALLPSADHRVSSAAAAALLQLGPEGAAALATIAAGTDSASAYAREALALAELERKRRVAARQPGSEIPVASPARTPATAAGR